MQGSLVALGAREHAAMPKGGRAVGAQAAAHHLQHQVRNL